MLNRYEILSVNGNYSLGSYPTLSVATKRFEEMKTAKFANIEEILADGIQLVKLVPVVIDTVAPKKKASKS